MQKHASAGSHLPALRVAVSRLSRSINGLEVVKPDTVRMVDIKEELEHPAVFPPPPVGTMGDWLQTLIDLVRQVTILTRTLPCSS